MRIELQTAYVLHTRPYRDTSLLVDFFTPEFGRVAAVARGVRQRKGGKRALLNPFNRLLISWQGKQSLKLLTASEMDGPGCFLAGAQLYSGFYLNELLVRLLPEMDAHARVFFDYQQSLQLLQSGAELEPLLRCFEFNVLQELGYAINFATDAYSGAAISTDEVYRFDSQAGFYLADPAEPFGPTPPGSFTAALSGATELPPVEKLPSLQSVSTQVTFSGTDILAIGVRDFSRTETRMAAKRLSRLSLQPLLGAKPLKSRELFAPVRR